MQKDSGMKWLLVFGALSIPWSGCGPGSDHDPGGTGGQTQPGHSTGSDAGASTTDAGALDAGEMLDAGTTMDAGLDVSFARDVRPLFAGCTGYCHPGGGAPMGLGAQEIWDNLVNASSTGCADGRLRVKPGDADPKQSYLVAKLMGVELCDGYRMGSLSDDQIEIVRAWIAAGARND